MTIQKIIGENGRQKEMCSGGACPDGNVYVQGYLPTSEAERALTAPSGEGFVSIPIETAKKIAAQVSEL